MMRSALLGFLLAVAACSSSTGGGGGGTPGASPDAAAEASTTVDAGVDAATDSAPSGGGCATLPASATKQGPGCTAPVAGTFTAITFDSVAGTYSETCDTPPYKDQAEFDANEGTSTQAGITIKSHEDYVVTSSCASGSIDYEATGSPKTTIVFIWTKVP